ncbi:MAG TPA: hypothetical protein VF260_04990 [Bacilli bacterium]
MKTIYDPVIPDKSSLQALYELTINPDASGKHFDEWYEAVKSGSWRAVSVYEDGILTGFGRIICDGSDHAAIADVIVAPSRQFSDIRANLLKLLKAECKFSANPFFKRPYHPFEDLQNQENRCNM